MNRIFILTEKRETGYGLASCLNDRSFKDIEKLKLESKKGYLKGEKYLISWSNGHCFETLPPQHYNPSFQLFSKLSTPAEYALKTLKSDLKKSPKMKNKKIGKQLSIVLDILNKNTFDEIMIATDADAEGEAIWRDILFSPLVKNKKYNQINRLWITGSFKSQKSIDKAISEKRAYTDAHFENLYAAQRARSDGDYIAGMKLNKVVSDHYGSVYYIGRVKAFIVGLIATRELDIKNFISKKYFLINGYLNNLDFKHYYVTGEEGEREKSLKYFTEQSVENVLLSLKSCGYRGQVIKSETATKVTKDKPLPLSGNEFSNIMMTLYKIDMKTSEAILQYLRDEGYTTYQGTNGHYFKLDDVDDAKVSFHSALQYFNMENENIPFSTSSPIFNDKKAEKQNHPPLHTTSKVPSNDTLKIWREHKLPNLKEAYELISKRILVSFLEDDLIENQNLTVEISGYKFERTGRRAINQGWRTFMNDEIKDTTFDSSLKVGDSITLDSCKVTDKMTTPPTNLSVQSLLKVMMNATREVDKLIKEEEDPERIKKLKKQKKGLKNAEGIGTDRTRQSIISILIEKEIVKSKGKEGILSLSAKGWDFYNIVPQKFMAIEYSASWENAFEDIRNGALSYEKFMNIIDDDIISNMLFPIIKNIGKKVQPKLFKSKEVKSLLLDCPLCSAPLEETDSIFKCSKSKWRDGKEKGCKFHIFKNQDKYLGRKLNILELELLLNDRVVGIGEKKIRFDAKNKYFISRVSSEKGVLSGS